jgi:hypothetical protein
MNNRKVRTELQANIRESDEQDSNKRHDADFSRPPGEFFVNQRGCSHWSPPRRSSQQLISSEDAPFCFYNVRDLNKWGLTFDDGIVQDRFVFRLVQIVVSRYLERRAA